MRGLNWLAGCDAVRGRFTPRIVQSADDKNNTNSVRVLSPQHMRPRSWWRHKHYQSYSPCLKSYFSTRRIFNKKTDTTTSFSVFRSAHPTGGGCFDVTSCPDAALWLAHTAPIETRALETMAATPSQFTDSYRQQGTSESIKTQSVSTRDSILAINTLLPQLFPMRVTEVVPTDVSIRCVFVYENVFVSLTKKQLTVSASYQNRVYRLKGSVNKHHVCVCVICTWPNKSDSRLKGLMV